MKAITITQPWATLVAIGAKKIETRSWSTRYRGPLAIHAAKGLGSVGGMRGLKKLCATQPFSLVLGGLELPLGAILATVDIVDVLSTEQVLAFISPQEKAFGDYSPGRFAWMLEDVRALPEPIPCKGALGLWNCRLEEFS